MGVTDHFGGCGDLKVNLVEVFDLRPSLFPDVVSFHEGNALLVEFFLHDMLRLLIITMTSSSSFEPYQSINDRAQKVSILKLELALYEVTKTLKISKIREFYFEEFKRGSPLYQF
jgi:hypothetical protein